MATIKLQNVRLSFPSLFEKAHFRDTITKYECSMLLPKSDVKTYNKILAVIEQGKKDAKVKFSAADTFIKDGDDVDYEGCANHWIIKASNNKRPTVIHRDKTPLVKEDEVIYAGCYANVIIEPWIQNNEFKKRANANLLGIQFVKDGTPFGDGGKVADADDFEDIDEDDDDVDDDY